MESIPLAEHTLLFWLASLSGIAGHENRESKSLFSLKISNHLSQPLHCNKKKTKL